MENVFEIKLFLKTEDDNVHIGSFMLDLNILLSERCKASNDIFLTIKNIKITFYDISQKKTENSLILYSKLVLIRSELKLSEFESMNNQLVDIFKSSSKRTQLLGDVEKNKQNAKELKKVLTNCFTENYYEEIDSNLMALDIDENTIPGNKTTNIDILINVFSNEESMANYQEYLLLKQKALDKGYINKNQKLKIRNGEKEKLFYKLSRKKLFELVNLEGENKDFLKECLTLYNKENTSYIDFEIIKVEYLVENETDKNNVNLFDFFYFLHVLLSDKGKQDKQHNVLIPSLTSKDKAFMASSLNHYEYDSCSNHNIKITVISAMRLTRNKHSNIINLI